ncbi:MEDS domain-containing protein [Nocardioides sp. CPCC 206347]|uniref:MEDS domain-containing protein n=1 Tax=unclassified Nocardioides TaxID=2615069 RepID=UPI0036232025
MTNTDDFFPAGAGMAAGDHLCGFYRNDHERDAIVIPFIEEGLAEGASCTCVVDSCTPTQVLDRLAQDIDLAPHLDAHHLEVLTADDTYLSRGTFLVEEMLQFWESKGRALWGDTVPEAPVRNLGDMSWAHRESVCFESLISYEAEINRIMRDFPQINLCLYDLNRCSGEVVMDVLKTHPKALLGGMVIDNPYYIDADELISSQPSQASPAPEMADAQTAAGK